jgi:myo-inositol 2-dehydrogenase / D-chiro-inositol 1-dehydrogenase
MNEKSTDSRRTFLKSSAQWAAAAAALPGYAAAGDTIRVGIIGSGGRGEAAAINAMGADKGVRIYAMADMRLDRMQEVRSKLRVEKPDQVDVKDERLFTGFAGYKSVIEACDVVIIANAAKFHPMHAGAAIDAGKHVFLEKPHAIDPRGVKTLRAVIEKARQKNLCLVSGLQSRYHPGYSETMQRVHDGAIGEIITIQETWLRPPYVLRQRQAGQSEIDHQASNQYHFHWLCGDDVPQTLIHNLDRSRWALREAVPLRAYGMGGRSSLHGEIYGDVFDHDAVVYDFPKGVRVYAYCRTIDNCYNENSSLITGTKGRCDLLQLRITGETNWQHPGTRSKDNAYDLEHVELFKAIRSGRAINNGDYMADSTLTGVMGQLSCYSGKEVRWEQVKTSDFYYAPLPEDCSEKTEPPVRPGPDGIYPVAFTPGVSKLV